MNACAVLCQYVWRDVSDLGSSTTMYTVLTNGELCCKGSCVSVQVNPSDEQCMETCLQRTDVNLQRCGVCSSHTQRTYMKERING